MAGGRIGFAASFVMEKLRSRRSNSIIRQSWGGIKAFIKVDKWESFASDVFGFSLSNTDRQSQSESRYSTTTQSENKDIALLHHLSSHACQSRINKRFFFILTSVRADYSNFQLSAD